MQWTWNPCCWMALGRNSVAHLHHKTSQDWIVEISGVQNSTKYKAEVIRLQVPLIPKDSFVDLLPLSPLAVAPSPLAVASVPPGSLKKLEICQFSATHAALCSEPSWPQIWSCWLGLGRSSVDCLHTNTLPITVAIESWQCIVGLQHCARTQAHCGHCEHWEHFVHCDQSHLPLQQLVVRCRSFENFRTTASQKI